MSVIPLERKALTEYVVFKVEKGLSSVEGVFDAKVNFATENANITYYPDQVQMDNNTIKKNRHLVGADQAQMAKIIGAPFRTYQNWEQPPE